MADEGQSLLGHPEIQGLFHDLLSNVIEESDRGAVLVGASYVEQHLGKLFEAVVPSDLGKKKRESLLNYPGPLSTFSARTEVAYATRLIGRSLYDALHALRDVRNEVAHEPTSFKLRDQKERILKMYALGPGMPVGINRAAIDLLMRSKVGHALELKSPIEEDQPLFKSPEEVVEYISQSPDIIEMLDEQLARYEFGVGLLVICALLVWHRDAACSVVGKSGTIALLVRRNFTSNELSRTSDAAEAEQDRSAGAREAAEPLPAADA